MLHCKKYNCQFVFVSPSLDSYVRDNVKREGSHASSQKSFKQRIQVKSRHCLHSTNKGKNDLHYLVKNKSQNLHQANKQVSIVNYQLHQDTGPTFGLCQQFHLGRDCCQTFASCLLSSYLISTRSDCCHLSFLLSLPRTLEAQTFKVECCCHKKQLHNLIHPL